MSKQFTVRARETVIREYTYDAETEEEARDAFRQGDNTSCLEVDLVDTEILSVKEGK